MPPNTAQPKPVWLRPPPHGDMAPETFLGLLLEWKQVGDQWHGLVTYARGGGAAPWSVTTEWVPAPFLAEAKVEPPAL